ncbi:MAG: hypothetical protein ACYC7A_20140 [Thermoanaerobaculia bacterium]
MLVYANHVRTISGTALRQVLMPIARWLSRKEPRRFSWQDLATDAVTRIGTSQVDVATAHASVPKLTAIRYRHRDRETSGRDWFVEIGVRENETGVSEVSFVLKTDEISSRVGGEIVATRPGIVAEIAAYDFLHPNTPGLQLLTLDEDGAHLFPEMVKSAQRRHPIVIVSPTPEQEYLVNPELLRLGIASE